MSKSSSGKPGDRPRAERRQYTRELGGGGPDGARRPFGGLGLPALGLTSPNLLYNWKRKLVAEGGAAAVGLEARVRELEAELRRVEQERDILKKALAIFGRGG